MRERVARRRRCAVAAIGIAAIAAAAAVGLTYTPLFHARSITVEGTEVLEDDQVIELAGVELGSDVLRLDTDAAEARLETEPWIAQADVERDLPDAVLISVVERQPLASGPDGELVAADGVVLPGSPVSGLPTIGSTDGLVSPSDLTTAAALLGALDPVVLVRVTSVFVAGDGTIDATLSAGTTVDFGEAGDTEEKAAALRAVLRWSSQRNVILDAIDVSVASAPAATLPGGAPVNPRS